MGYLYSYIGVGLSALARFGKLGQCEDLRIVERVTGLAPRFLMYIP